MFVCLFKIRFTSRSLLPREYRLWNALHKQVSSERRAKHLAKWEIWSRSALSPLCKFVLHSLRLWLSICQNTVVVWGQEGWHKANLTLSHLYVHLKRLTREMGPARVWHQSSQNTAATWNSWRLLQRWAECSVLSAPTRSSSVWRAGHWRGIAQKSSLYFLTLFSLLALEVIPLVQILCCRAPSVGPSIWILYILFPPRVLEELQLGEGDSFWWEVGDPVKTNKTSKWLCHVQPHRGSVGFISSTVQNR